MKTNKKKQFFLIYIVTITIVLVVGLEFASRFFLKAPELSEMFYKKNFWRDEYDSKLEDNKSYTTFDKLLGWKIRPNALRKYENRVGKKVVYKSNVSGFRGNIDYKPHSGKTRIAAFGDSFVHCDEVSFNESWPHILEKKLKNNFEVLNFGVGGYGTDQAFLRYINMGVNFHPNIVIIGFTLDDMKRNVNIFRFLLNPLTKVPFSKPRFVLKKEELKAINNPVKFLIKLKDAVINIHNSSFVRKYDYFYNKTVFDYAPFYYFAFSRAVTERIRWRRYGLERMCVPENEAFKISVKILQSFYNLVITNGATPIIIIFADYYNMQNYKEGNVYWKDFLKELNNLKLNYIDLAPHFSNKDIPLEKLYVGGKGHPNLIGNTITAQAVAYWIERNTK